jgi:hypothetical protein
VDGAAHPRRRRRAEEPDRRRAEAALAGTGCEALLAHRPRHRLGKRRFQLVFA